MELPRFGVEAISQEDLQRDVWALVQAGNRSPGEAGARQATEHIERRLQQMHTLPAFGESYRLAVGEGWMVCGQRDGRSGRGMLVVAEDPGQGAAAGAVPAAAVISLAKSTDGSVPTDTWIFCVAPQEGGLDAYLAQPAMPLEATVAVHWVGPLEGSGLVDVTGEAVGERPTRRWTTGVDPIHGTAQDGMERVDYRAVRERLVEVYAGLREMQAD